ncbi:MULTISPECIES: response regulator transcription factor [unclassified Breznakia]|uniref:response regulator transcription factor n=1 Tax=unclassified Breznakia TaxID=2623764 RepID=UPI00247338DF|nr:MULTISPECIES: response regulator transcription factor [unclassified Breznakia]MDH6365963.1 DNA-binding response OmpR family regulator [Breznakia sp. PH1-1]MDH6403105.1 DNA-binding response OmpR family regulator [Breznakia sp. PF1-11]MDH6410814.1 DNA-binding response OmpR family regulator [Breznakia sp. PFB1-11]MDH6413129.1 DNA-binding response OmpR family regulator [Breznakia sp. PFB1-14]MDH6415497.1 DNA-binding response OmpR family regulator [Breznakia sp. PFB1-4]
MNRILLVDDNETYANTLKGELEKRGHEVTYLSSPMEAVAQYVKEPYSLVVSDYKMDEMDGVKMVSILKKINPSIRSIIMTAFPGEEIELAALEASVDHYLSKDKSIAIMVKYIEDLLSKEIVKRDMAGTELISHTENIVVDLRSRLVYKDNELAEITRKEYELLVIFLENKGVALSRDVIAERLWAIDIENVELRVIDGHVKRLRSKLGIFCISSIRGFGYKWNE